MEQERDEIAGRIAALDWARIGASLDILGYATTGPLLSEEQCNALTALYDTPNRFRSRVVMARHGYGEGEYQYLSYPLPDIVQTLRETLYPRLVPVANRWAELLRSPQNFPERHSDYLEQCHAAGQAKPTPLLLRYEVGGYNRLHQDLYGELVFPMQAAILLSRPTQDFEGGEFIVAEQRPRIQSRVEIVPLNQGEGVIFAVRDRPVQGTRGVYRATMRHGVSRLRGGQRFTLGVIFHDAG